MGYVVECSGKFSSNGPKPMAGTLEDALEKARARVRERQEARAGGPGPDNIWNTPDDVPPGTPSTPPTQAPTAGPVADDPLTKNVVMYAGAAVLGLLLIRALTRKPKRRNNPYRRNQLPAQRRRTLPARRRSEEDWIKGAVKKPGSFTKYMRRRFGEAAFTPRNTLKMRYVDYVIADPRARELTHDRARLARTFKRMRH